MKKLLTSLAISFTTLFMLATPAVAHATPILFADNTAAKNAVCQGVGGGAENGSCSTNNGVDINSVLKVALNLLSFVAGVAAVIMIIVSGIRYTTSGGDSAGVAGAKTGIIYALVGLVVVVLAQSIVFFVLQKANQPSCSSAQRYNKSSNTCVAK